MLLRTFKTKQGTVPPGTGSRSFLVFNKNLRASIYGKKKFKFLLALLDPKNQQKSIQYLQSGKKTLNYSSLDPPYFDQFVPSLKMLIFGGKSAGGRDPFRRVLLILIGIQNFVGDIHEIYSKNI